MGANLDTLKDEVEKYLSEQGFNVFYGLSRVADSLPIIYWDCQRSADFRQYLEVARKSAVELIVFHYQEFTPDNIDDALDQLEAAGMPPEDQHTMERRLKELRAYEGFTCAVELSFDHEGRVYVFDLRTDWYNELTDIMDEIEMFGADVDEDDEGPIGGGYFSRN